MTIFRNLLGFPVRLRNLNDEIINIPPFALVANIEVNHACEKIVFVDDKPHRIHGIEYGKVYCEEYGRCGERVPFLPAKDDTYLIVPDIIRHTLSQRTDLFTLSNYDKDLNCFNCLLGNPQQHTFYISQTVFFAHPGHGEALRGEILSIHREICVMAGMNPWQRINKVKNTISDLTTTFYTISRYGQEFKIHESAVFGNEADCDRFIQSNAEIFSDQKHRYRNLYE